jgi:hypothetical protein
MLPSEDLDILVGHDLAAVEDILRVLADLDYVKDVVVGEQDHRIGVGEFLRCRLDACHDGVHLAGLDDMRVGGPHVRSHAPQQLRDP